MNWLSLDVLFFTYIGMMSIIGFYMMRADKERAKNNEYRIAEKTLWTVTMMGGALGTYCGMKQFRHKTKHISFRIGLPFFSFLYLVIASVILFNK
ncbi:DUF1294 domain-containing protein [Jeotgalibacillus marinus]|uniref:DUF1294 domain-containing protein n=1 Tax=Jeotgalibacillus marinus TaxID=86667 RepID=A0ABV3Q1F1_9BACL